MGFDTGLLTVARLHSQISRLRTELQIERDAAIVRENANDDLREEIEELRAELLIAQGQRGDIYNVTTK